MHARRLVFTFALAVTFAALIIVLGFTPPTAQAQSPDKEAAAACTAPFKQKWMPKGNCNTDPAQHFLGTLDNKPLVIKTNAAERMRIAANGNVGIGTNNPAAKLTVNGTVHSTTGGFKFPDGSTQMTAVSSSDFVNRHGDTMFGPLNLPSNGLKIGANHFLMGNGDIGIGTQPNANARLTVKSNQFGGLMVLQPNGNSAFSVNKDGLVFIRGLSAGSWTSHICSDGQEGGYLGLCASAAEYVPSIDGGQGFPQTADLVSIAPTLKNPYGDTHSPFTVQKSATACDPNLLGFIVNPESGADGKKLNDHYLPLAIYGYFPAKVTIENGFIRRGDALTSSSKPGYAMKATDACKIIGYALEDTNAKRQIQVFAELGENSAPQVAKLQARVEELEQQNATLEARLAALEQALEVQTQPADNHKAAAVTSR